jgi:hypothetical protein
VRKYEINLGGTTRNKSDQSNGLKKTEEEEKESLGTLTMQIGQLIEFGDTEIRRLQIRFRHLQVITWQCKKDRKTDDEEQTKPFKKSKTSKKKTLNNNVCLTSL